MVTGDPGTKAARAVLMDVLDLLREYGDSVVVAGGWVPSLSPSKGIMPHVGTADVDLVNIRYIIEGRQSVDVWKLIEPLAETAAEVAVKLAQNPEKKVTEIIKPDKMVNNGLFDIPTIVTPVKLVTRGNINETLIQGGVYSWDQVYGKEPISEKP